MKSVLYGVSNIIKVLVMINYFDMNYLIQHYMF